MSDRWWSPAMSTSHYDRRPPVGALIALDRKPWRVRTVEDIPADEWSDEHRDVWLRDGMPDPWRSRPFRVEVESPAGIEAGTATVGPRNHPTWHVLPEHYAVCVTCGELAPCREHTAMKQAEAEMARLEKQMRLMPGCCPACQEPITSRQQTVTFPGENLLLITGAPDPVFHLRQACRDGAARYEEMWVRADPTRPRSLLTLRCRGLLVVHHDGSAECHGAPDCPSVYAHHGHLTACYAQSHGCGRGCSPVGHPGCRVRRDSTTSIRP